MYIACVMEVLRGLRGRAVEAGVQLVTINALSLPTPQVWRVKGVGMGRGDVLCRI